MTDFEKRPIIDVIEELGYDLEPHLYGARPYHLMLCPFHDDHNPSLHVSVMTQRYRCWSCGAHGDVIQFVQDAMHVSFAEALRISTNPISPEIALSRKLADYKPPEADVVLLHQRAAKVFARPRHLIFQKGQAVLAEFDAYMFLKDWYGADQLLKRNGL